MIVMFGTTTGKWHVILGCGKLYIVILGWPRLVYHGEVMEYWCVGSTQSYIWVTTIGVTNNDSNIASIYYKV